MNGDYYEGPWIDDQREGKDGKYEFYEQGEKYEGDFKKGLKEGEGVYYFTNGD